VPAHQLPAEHEQVRRGVIWLDRRLCGASVSFVRDSSVHLVERWRPWVPELPICDKGEFCRRTAASHHPGKRRGQCAPHASKKSSSDFARVSDMTTIRSARLRAQEILSSCAGYGAVAADEARDQRCRRASHSALIPAVPVARGLTVMQCPRDSEQREHRSQHR
jgi:hypothetical protein